jgi:hypothetical protein
MTGVVVYETRGDRLHAHPVIRQPAQASDFHFRMNAPVWWSEVAPDGNMHLTKIKPTQEDMSRVCNYVLKDITWSRVDGDTWKFVDDLSRRPVAT